MPRGMAVPVEQTWRLAQTWYPDRLDLEWTPRAPAQSERLLASVGLTGEYWRMT